jgi:hypothetical protein
MKLSDIIRYSDHNHLKMTLEEMAIHFEKTSHWISANHTATGESRVLENILQGSSNYMKLVAENLDNHISILGTAVRALYEIRLRTELLVTNKGEFDKWQAESGTDKIQLLEAIQSMKTADMITQRTILKGEIERIRTLLRKHGLEEAKPLGAADIAKKLGKEEEHRSLFKLLSKIVHPSSYLINDYANAASDEIYQILQAHAQLYAWDIYERTCNYLLVPENIRTSKFLAGNECR